jgi:hypothetical protein
MGGKMGGKMGGGSGPQIRDPWLWGDTTHGPSLEVDDFW